MSRFLKEEYKSLVPYTPGEQPQDRRYIKLNTNESPYPPAPGTAEAVAEKIDGLCLYPDPKCSLLSEKIAGLYGVNKENVFLSNGSDDILNFAFMAFGKKVCFADITYGFYSVFSDLHGCAAEIIPLKEDFSISPSDYLGKGKMVVIANPNAPTGMCLTVSEIEKIVSSNPDNIVLIDEAYVDFGAESAAPLTKKYDNLLVVMTFSKSRSMAGARVGFAIAGEEIIEDLNKIKYQTNPYSINSMSYAAALFAAENNEYYMNNCKKIIKTREYTVSELEKLGFEVLNSKANFVFARHRSVPGEKIYRELKESGILVRHFNASRINDFNRISIGTREEMERFLTETEKIIKQVM